MIRLLAVASLAAIAFVQPASATIITFHATLSGAKEFPPNLSPGTGTVTLLWDDALNTMRIMGSFSGLTGNTTATHIHGATAVPGTGNAGVATTTPSFVGFPLGVKSGAWDLTYDMTLLSSYNAAFVTANGGSIPSARTALFNAIDNGRAYFNIHTQAFGGGEIRGFFEDGPLPTPEPSSLALLGAGLLGLTLRRRR